MEPTVVSAVDLESDDRAAVGLGDLLARLLTARHVVVAVRPGGSPSERLFRLELSGCRSSVSADLPATLRPRDAEVREVVAPSTAAGLHAVLVRERPALAVIGSPRHGTHGSVGLGDTGERMLDAAPCPVAIAPRGYVTRDGLARIAVAVLPSPEGRSALAAGARLAHAAGAVLRVLMVLIDTPDMDDARAIVHGLVPDADWAPEEDDAAGILAPAIAAAVNDVPRRPGTRPPQLQTGILVGDPVDALVRASSTSDVLVLGSRAYGPPHAVLTGGVARRVLGRARCPVVLTPRVGGDAIA